MRNRMFEQRPFRLGTARMGASLKLIYKLELRFCLCHSLICDAHLLCVLFSLSPEPITSSLFLCEDAMDTREHLAL